MRDPVFHERLHRHLDLTDEQRSEIAEILGMDKLSNLSQQLKVLRLAGIIQCHREEKQMVYTLNDERVRDMIGYFKAKYL